MSLVDLYPSSPREALAQLYVGKSLGDLPTPAAVINAAAVRKNCKRMLQTCDRLGLGWRAHVKTHKVSDSVTLPLPAVRGRQMQLAHRFTDRQWKLRSSKLEKMRASR